MKTKLRYLGYIEFDEREFNGHLIGIAEDPTKEMMRSDGTSELYAIYIKKINKKTNQWYKYDPCYITRLGCKKYGCKNAKEFALEIFKNPDDYKNILGETWMGYKSSSNIPKKVTSLG